MKKKFNFKVLIGVTLALLLIGGTTLVGFNSDSLFGEGAFYAKRFNNTKSIQKISKTQSLKDIQKTQSLKSLQKTPINSLNLELSKKVVDSQIQRNPEVHSTNNNLNNEQIRFCLMQKFWLERSADFNQSIDYCADYPILRDHARHQKVSSQFPGLKRFTCDNLGLFQQINRSSNQENTLVLKTACTILYPLANFQWSQNVDCNTTPDDPSCIEPDPICEDGFILNDGVCIELPPVCEDGYMLEDGECVEIPELCEESHTCPIECSDGSFVNYNESCPPELIMCPDGVNQVTDLDSCPVAIPSCNAGQALTCPEGIVLETDACSDGSTPVCEDQLETIPVYIKDNSEYFYGGSAILPGDTNVGIGGFAFYSEVGIEFDNLTVQIYDDRDMFSTIYAESTDYFNYATTPEVPYVDEVSFSEIGFTSLNNNGFDSINIYVNVKDDIVGGDVYTTLSLEDLEIRATNGNDYNFEPHFVDSNLNIIDEIDPYRISIQGTTSSLEISKITMSPPLDNPIRTRGLENEVIGKYTVTNHNTESVSLIDLLLKVTGPSETIQYLLIRDDQFRAITHAPTIEDPEDPYGGYIDFDDNNEINLDISNFIIAAGDTREFYIRLSPRQNLVEETGVCSEPYTIKIIGAESRLNGDIVTINESTETNNIQSCPVN